MVALLNLAAEKFDQVIIDGPPVLGLADAPLLGSLVEATIMVAECRRHQPAFRARRRQAPAQHAHAAGRGRTDQGGYAEPFLRLPRLLLSVR